MGDYPLRATHGKVHIDDASDLRALMIADAAGQLGYQSAMTELYPGDLWIDLLRSEPKFFNAVAPIVEEFLSDADARRREIGLRIVQKFPEARFAAALRAAFERDAALFVGVESPTGLGETLFRQWLEAMCLCGVKAPAELKRAAALATPYLDLVETAQYAYLLPTYAGEPIAQWLPAILPRLIADGLDGFLAGVSPRDLPDAAAALQAVSIDQRREFSQAVHVHLAKRWPADAAAVSADVDAKLGLSSG